MKNVIFIVAVILMSTTCFAQMVVSNDLKKADKDKLKGNELKIGAIKLLAGPILDIEYERLLSKNYSVGGNAIINLNTEAYSSNFSLSPFFRIYFTETKEFGSEGFFAQTFLMYNNGDYQESTFNPSTLFYEGRTETYNSLGIGFGIGKKWVNEAGFLVQLSIGGARTIAGDERAPEVSFLGDAAIGYRF